MKYSLVYVPFFIFLLALHGSIDAVSFDGKTSPVYKTTHHVFHDRDTVEGFVDLCKGFTVVPVASGPQSTHGANLYMDTSVTVSGAIDLRGTNTLTLLRDLYLDDGVSFSDSGRIYGYGNALVMRGDLTIPADKVLYCGGNLIINGQGHTLHMGSSSQIFLDNSSTLTLRNMIIETGHTYPGQPALNISSSLSRLAFDNVVLSLGDDLHIPRGQLFFHNDVVVTGTSALVYRSCAPSYIASHGTLMFDHGTTFSYAPATNNKDLIVLNDASSTLALNGCSLKATHTGLRLTKGRLYFDDKVTVDGKAYNKLNGLSALAGATLPYGTVAHSTSWSPDGKFLAVGGNNGTNDLTLYRFDGANLTSVQSLSYGDSPRSLSWSPDGKYLAAAGVGASYGAVVYGFNGTALTDINGAKIDSGVSDYSVAWSPDGKYLAVGGLGAFNIYRFDGTSLVALPGTTRTVAGKQVLTISWSCDGKYLAFGYQELAGSEHELRVCRFDGTTLVDVCSKDYGLGVWGVAWSPDGRFLAVGGVNDLADLTIYSFDGTALTSKATSNFVNFVYAITWSPDGRYLGVGGNNDNNSDLIVYGFNGTSLMLIAEASFGEYIHASAWSPDGQYLAVGGDNGDTDLIVYRCLYINDTSEPYNQIAFGNSAAGPTHDLDVHVLAGAQVAVTGKVFHDPA